MKEELKKAKIVPVVKLEEYEKAELLAEALRKGGINCAEITFRASGLILSNVPSMLKVV